MAQNRFKKIKGTKDFLILTVVCVFLCLWSIRDAWFPTEKTLKKHPQSYPVTVSVSGVVQHIPVKAGDEVGGGIPLIILGTQSYKEAVATAENTYKAEVKKKSGEIQAARDALLQAQANLKAATVTCSDFSLETTHGTESLHGVVLDVLAQTATWVEAGETVMLVRPKDTFYAFNKTLAILTFFGALGGLVFHRIASL